MATTIKSTSDVHHQNGVKIVVYGQSGAGKTCLIPTLPSPIIISAEAGLLSIASANLPYISVSSIAETVDAWKFLHESHEAAQFESVAVDSLSEIAELILVAEMKNQKDGRAAYGEMALQVMQVIRAFRDLKKHVYFSAKAEKSQDETGRMLYAPAMPGNKLGQQIPYLVDEVFALRVETATDGTASRALQCHPNGTWQAKDRSGSLAAWEPLDLGHVIRKISGAQA